MPKPKTRILFVCLGNICRSPMAEAIFLHQVREQNLEDQFEVDSAGTGDWHAGQMPDHRTLATLKAHGIAPASRARQVTSGDFENFDLIIAMDHQNVRDLKAWKGSKPEKIHLMLDWHPTPPTQEVPDPYYGYQSDFESVSELLTTACQALIQTRINKPRRSASDDPRS